MTPPASILFPTRRRREYLAVALASLSTSIDSMSFGLSEASGFW